jgi:outer membrane lipoprotein-sorting protein
MKHTLCVLCASLLLASAARGADTPTAEQVLQKYLQAIGGKAAVERLTSRVSKGTVDNSDDGSTSPIEIYAKVPAQYAASWNVSGYGIVATVWDGTSGWTKNPDSGVQAMSKNEVAAAGRNYAFHREAKLNELYPTMTVSGQLSISDSPAYIIEAAAGQASERLYFDAQTGLLVRRDLETVTFEDGIVPFEIYYDDYREVDGVKIPFTVRRKTPDYTLTFKFTEVRHNVPIDEAVFAKPGK